jgi:hypothetical protein
LPRLGVAAGEGEGIGQKEKKAVVRSLNAKSGY